MAGRIYLDHAATTPVLPEVAEAMAPWIREKFGNPSSLYFEGREARAAIDRSREIISRALGCEFGEVIFTSSGTEAANMAIIGAALANEDQGRTRILFGAAEHHCILNTRDTLERLGYGVEFIPVERYALPVMDAFERLMGEDVLLVSVMAANNELGTIVDVDAVTDLAHQFGALYFSDAVQMPPFHHPFNADLLSLAAHKINGPKGAGALFVRAGTRVKPLIAGGGQERELRAGTEDVAAIVGFAEAVRIHAGQSDSFEQEKGAARDAFVTQLQSLNIPGLVFTTDHGDQVLPGHCHLRVEGISAETMLILLDREGISASSGAACSSGSIEPSHVLLACGYSERETREGLRFTFGLGNTVEEARVAGGILATCASGLACLAYDPEANDISDFAPLQAKVMKRID